MANKDVFKNPVLFSKAMAPWWGSSLDFYLNPCLQAQREHAPRNVLSQHALLQGHTLWGISHSQLIRSKLKLNKS